jgi:NAD(P)-dependent dehydrogenase (short-subunit alcohol dehydrogenase family)
MVCAEGKTVIVTGAAKGIGRAEAEQLAAAGARVVLTDIDDTLGEKAAAAIGGDALYLHHDVTSSADWAGVIAATVERFGALHGLVNNAGIYLPGTIASTTEEILDRQIAVNHKGPFLGLQHASAQMIRQGRPTSRAWCAS